MKLVLLLVAAMCVAVPASTQTPPVSSAPTAQSPATDAQPDEATDLPVSLDRIREALKKPQDSKLRTLDVKPDFTMQIQEQQRIDQLMSKLDFKSGPAPAGGLYGLEQQQRLFNPTDHPLEQPYGAYNGGELITIAIENLIAKYLGGRALNAVTAAERARAEARAREEVNQAIAEYCAGRPDQGSIQICTSTPDQR